MKKEDTRDESKGWKVRESERVRGLFKKRETMNEEIDG